jgi:hypothetical protein
VALVGKEVEMKRGGVSGIPMQERTVNPDCVMVDPAIHSIKMEPVERTLERRAC